MEIKSTLTGNELRKVALLVLKASEVGMNISGYGFADVNPNSGNVYLWVEDYPFCIFIPPSSDDIYASWSNPENGEEHEIEVVGMDLDDLCAWVDGLEQGEED